ncbi:hypothetical protein AAG589_02840 [Isoptericola sp. F-RaC21]|uniref:hypothetical protein n=1 Tax=Isoptericola sp. F-RaC21 TaxID=3141452 RepID=UPI00315B5BCB
MFTPEQVRDLVEGRPVVDDFAYGRSDEAAVRALHRTVCREVERRTGTRSRIAWDHYGSGYASFVDAWFFRDEPGWAGRKAGGDRSWQGLTVLLSRLSPYVVFLEGNRSWGERTGSADMPTFAGVDRLTTPAVAEIAPQVQAVVERHGLVRLHASDLGTPLAPDVQVPTLLSDPGSYREFDALFHWED